LTAAQDEKEVKTAEEVLKNSCQHFSIDPDKPAASC
jgi:hypothetical protein